MKTEDMPVMVERCNKQGKIFAMANRLGHELKGYVERYMTSELAAGGKDDDYSYYQIAAPSYSLDLIEDEELHTEGATPGGYSNDEAYWIGFFYKYLILALDQRSEEVIRQVPFDRMHAFYGEYGTLPKEEAGRLLLARVRGGEGGA